MCIERLIKSVLFRGTGQSSYEFKVGIGQLFWSDSKQIKILMDLYNLSQSQMIH